MSFNFPIRCGWFTYGCLALVWLGSATSSQAQGVRGFARTAPAVIVNEEIVRQPDLWVMEVQLKPVRLVWVEMTDPQTGEATKEQIWYLPWRAIRRPLAARPTEDIYPVNQPDPLPGPPQFVPEFTLVNYDNPDSEIPNQILVDQILPEAMKDVRRIERGMYLTSAGAIQDVPEAVPQDAEEQPWIYGAATWRGVDPDTDFFKVILSGFSNGYEVRTSDTGTESIWRKVIVQRFARPGDRFDPNLKEFQFVGMPEWIFQPEAGSAEIPMPRTTAP